MYLMALLTSSPKSKTLLIRLNIYYTKTKKNGTLRKENPAGGGRRTNGEHIIFQEIDLNKIPKYSYTVVQMSGFERKNLPNGKPNPKYIDLCDEDPPLAGQKFACVSFVSPEKILKKRELYLFEQFVKQWDLSKSMGKYFDFLNFIAYKYNLKIDELSADFNEFTKEEEAKLKATSTAEDDYKNFLDKQEDALTEKFSREHAFQTSVRGLKIRGIYSTQEEAEIRCKKLRELDPHHDIYVGPVGMWIPWDPDAYKTGRVEFMEEELNQLHKEKLKNEERAKQDFENRVKETKKRAIQENIEKASNSGNVLTQTLDENGNLLGVREKINFEEREEANADVRMELLKQAIENEKKTLAGEREGKDENVQLTIGSEETAQSIDL